MAERTNQQKLDDVQYILTAKDGQGPLAAPMAGTSFTRRRSLAGMVRCLSLPVSPALTKV